MKTPIPHNRNKTTSQKASGKSILSKLIKAMLFVMKYSLAFIFFAAVTLTMQKTSNPKPFSIYDADRQADAITERKLKNGEYVTHLTARQMQLFKAMLKENSALSGAIPRKTLASQGLPQEESTTSGLMRATSGGGSDEPDEPFSPLNFTTDVTIDNSGSDQYSPDVCSNNDNTDNSSVYIAYHNIVNGDVMFAKSVDGGVTFSAPIIASPHPYPASIYSTNQAQIAVNGSNVHIVFMAPWNDYDFDIFYARSTDGGASFNTYGIAVSDECELFPNVAVDASGYVYITYTFLYFRTGDFCDAGGYEEGNSWAVVSADNGVNFSAATAMTTDNDGGSQIKIIPAIELSGSGASSNLHLLINYDYANDYLNSGSSHWQIYYRKVTNAGSIASGVIDEKWNAGWGSWTTSGECNIVSANCGLSCPTAFISQPDAGGDSYIEHSLAGFTGGNLSFFAHVDQEGSGWDYVYAEYFSGAWVTGWSITGSYIPGRRISFAVPAGATAIRFRAWASDGTSNAGGLWVDDIILTNHTLGPYTWISNYGGTGETYAFQNAIDVDNSGNPYVVWTRASNNVYFRKSTNGGSSFLGEVLIEGTSAHEACVNVDEDGNPLVLCGYDSPADLHLNWSDEGGAVGTWEGPVTIDDDANAADIGALSVHHNATRRRIDVTWEYLQGSSNCDIKYDKNLQWRCEITLTGVDATYWLETDALTSFGADRNKTYTSSGTYIIYVDDGGRLEFPVNTDGGSPPNTTVDLVIWDPVNASFSASIHYGAGCMPGLWTGATSDDWNTAGNWHCTAIPNATTPVSIPASIAGSAFWPTKSGNLTVGTDCASITMAGNSELTVTGDLIINSGATMDCSGATPTINIAGDWSNAGTFAPGNSTVLFNSGGTGTITNTAIIDILTEDWESGTAGWTLESSGRAVWERHTCSAHNGSYGANILDDQATPAHCDYPWDQAATIDCYHTLDLTGYTAASLTFWWMAEGEHTGATYYDYGQVLIDAAVVSDHLCEQNVYIEHSAINLNSYCGSSRTLRFRWINDGGTGTAPGYCIDDILVTGTPTNGTETFYNLSVDKTNSTDEVESITSTTELVVLNNLTIIKGVFKPYTKSDFENIIIGTTGEFFAPADITYSGDFENNGTFTHNNGGVTFDGAGTICGTENTTFYNYAKNGSGELLIGDPATADKTILVGNNWNWIDNNDKITVGNEQNVYFQIPANMTIADGCELAQHPTADSEIKVPGNWVDNGTYTAGSGTVTFFGTASSTVSGPVGGTSDFYTEDFSSGWDSDWTVTDNGTAGVCDDLYVWVDNNPGGQSTGGGVTAPFLICDSDGPGSGCVGGLGPMDGDVVSNAIDCSGRTNVHLKFNHYFRSGSYTTDQGQVSIRIGAGGWNVQATFTEDNSTPQDIDISALADGQSEVYIKFNFYCNEWAWYWMIDDIVLNGSAAADEEVFYNLNVDKSGVGQVELGSNIRVVNIMHMIDGAMDLQPGATPYTIDYTP